MIRLLKTCNRLNYFGQKKRQQRLDYINDEIAKEHNAEKRFADLSSAMQQYFIVTPPKPVLSDFYVPSEDHHNRELAFVYIHINGWNRSLSVVL